MQDLDSITDAAKVLGHTVKVRPAKNPVSCTQKKTFYGGAILHNHFDQGSGTTNHDCQMSTLLPQAHGCGARICHVSLRTLAYMLNPGGGGAILRCTLPSKGAHVLWYAV